MDDRKKLEDATHACMEGRFDEAFAGFSEVAETGDVGAARGLADMYLRGEGVSPNIEKGLELLRYAASRGDANAAFNLGALHRTGADGVPIDPDKSKHFFILARELGCELPIEDYL